MSSLKAGGLIHLPFVIPQVELLAGTVIELIAPEDGYIDELALAVQTAVTTGGDVVVKTGDALGTTVAGISVTIADGATKGTRASEAATRGSSTRFVSKGDRIGIEPSSGFATAGALAGVLTCASSDDSPALPAAS